MMTEAEDLRLQFAEEFAQNWERAGAPRIDGRVLGYLLMMDKDRISSEELAQALDSSSGSISISTRRLVEYGYVRKHVVPKDRKHYFSVDDDLWGTYLAQERPHLVRHKELFERALEHDDLKESRAKNRLLNARNYMHWVHGYHTIMLNDWKKYKDSQSPD